MLSLRRVLLLGCIVLAVLALRAEVTTAAPSTLPYSTVDDDGDGDADDDDAPPIKIGVILPMSGVLATYGEQTWQGIRLAVPEDALANGRRVELVLYDNESELSISLARAKEAVNAGCRAVIGCVASSNTMKAAGHLQAEGVPLLAPTATNERVTEIGNYIFRNCYVDAVQGTAAARFAMQLMKDRGRQQPVAATVTDEWMDYCVTQRDLFITAWSGNGGGMVAEVTYTGGSDGDADFSKQVSSVVESGAQVVFIPGFYPDVASMLRIGRENLKGKLVLGTDGWDSPDLIAIAGKDVFEAKGGLECYFTSHFAADRETSATSDFVQAFELAYGKQPGSIAALGYDAGGLMLDAIRRVDGAITSDAIRDALAATRDYAGVVTTFSIQEGGDSDAQPVMVRVTPDGFLAEGVKQIDDD